MYRLLTILVGLPLMLVWGLVFGVYTFVMVWIGTPMRRLTQSVIAEFGIYIQTISDAVIAPVYRSIGQVWSNVRVTVNSQEINSIKQIQV
jgi:caveolin 1